MVAHSRVEGNDNHLLPATSSASTISSSLSASSSPSFPPRHQRPPTRLPQPAPDPNLVSRKASVPLKLSTHFPPFHCQKDYGLIMDTAQKLEHSGFYWGPLGVEDAHRMLRDAPHGAFLIRDSRQKDVFFTLSYQAKGGPVSVRILYRQQHFSLAGSQHSFPSLFALLEHYVASPKRSLSVPYRKHKPTLQELCRKRIMEACGEERRVLELPVTRVLQDFLCEFPYKL